MSPLTLSRLAALPSILLAPILMGATTLALAVPAGAQVRVGVTSAAEGDPLGKPPAEAERVLRVGVDVQASELITTSVNDRAHLVFLDGTSLTVGPDAQLVIDRFIYDPSRGIGDLSVTLSKGVLRLVGGKISKMQPVLVNTPGVLTGIRGGISIVDAQAGQTVSTFMFGRDMTVTGRGQTQTVTRPGFEVTTRVNAPPAPPAPVSEQMLNAQIAKLEGRSGSSGRGNAAATGAAVVKVTQGTQGLAAQPQQSTPGNARTGQPTAPQPVSWQQWGGGVAYQNPAAVNPAITGGTAALVPGAIPTVAQLPTTGTATYNGSFSVIQNPGGITAGSVAIGWNFGNQTGNFLAVANGQNGMSGSATAPLKLNPGTANFSGPLTVNNVTGTGNGSGSGSVNGNFVSTSSSPVGAVGGSITGKGNDGSISGTFKATK
jgi:hypothetical protein